ncbi:regucalcin [Pedobacter ginsengisoli]|uniref:Regucalcin n=1 Tax=Pedobacter ginsengisoli TaxID=363852 RepID=A0A2D1U3F3_9SPHI|nr:SMP-30/gluconolactonase/LRE family protein [Pedobacter ginsengisoli]ATP56147.1 regucalcin [Pedobacter ginsengisoli]
MVNKTGAAVLYPSGCVLGESPMWHNERQSCFWVDIEGCMIYEYSLASKTCSQYQLASRVSLIVKSNTADELILGLQGGVARFNLVTETLSIITADLNADWKTYRCNDGGCDNMGRLWISTTELKHKADAGALYCVDKNTKVSEKMDKLSISNGMAWTADNKRLYHTDSITGAIKSYLYDELAGDLEFERIVVQVPLEKGLPDGIALDAEGKLWIALWGGYGVGRFDVESGEMIGFIDIPAPNVSSCAFVGEALDRMIITTAKKEMTENDLKEFPQSGHIFIVGPGVTGAQVFNCAL